MLSSLVGARCERRFFEPQDAGHAASRLGTSVKSLSPNCHHSWHDDMSRSLDNTIVHYWSRLSSGRLTRRLARSGVEAYEESDFGCRRSYRSRANGRPNFRSACACGTRGSRAADAACDFSATDECRTRRSSGGLHRGEDRLSAQYAVVAFEHSGAIGIGARRTRRPLDHLPRRRRRHQTLVGFLVNDCCGGHPELCDLQDAIREASCGCAPGRKSRKRRS